MSTTIKEFLIGLGFEVEGEGSFGNAIQTATLAVAGLGAAVFAAGGALFAFTSQVADYYDNLGDLAGRIDTTVGEIEELGYVAMLSGSSFEASAASLENLSKVAGDAANGMGKGQKIFDQLGVSLKDANGKLKNSTELLFDVGDKIKDMETSKQIAILERLGIDKTMVGAITDDVTGLRDEFRKLNEGVGLNADEAAEKSGRFMDTLDTLSYVVTTVGRALAVHFMDKFTDAMDTLRKMIVDNLPAIMKAVKPIITIILTLADVFIALVYRIAQGAGVIIGWVSDIIATTNKWVVAIGAIVVAWKYLNLSFLATPVGAVLGLIVALGLLVDDFMTWKEGGESLIDWGKWQTEIDMAIAIFGVLKEVVTQLFTYVGEMINAAVALISGDWAGAFAHVQAALAALVGAFFTLFQPVFDWLKESFGSTFQYISDLIAATVGKITAVVDWAKGAAASIGNIFSSEEEAAVGASSMPPALAPSASNAPQAANQNVTQETNITLQGGGDPQANARAISAQQNQVNGDMARNLKGAAR